MERDDLAIDGLLRELARAPEGEDHAFVARVLARTQQPTLPRAPILAAAAILFAMGVFLALTPAAPTVRIVAVRPLCVADAARMRLLMKDPATSGLLLLGEVPVGASARVPAGSEILFQAVGADGMALWTSPRATKVAGAPVPLDRKDARSVEFSRDVKPILDLHCSGCHAEADLVRGAVHPFEARRSPLVTQTHAPLSGAERQQLALWVDLGATGRP
jgi:hypothetical protein